MEGKYWDDMKVGDKNITGARTITETDLVNFIAVAGMYVPLFLDREFATKQSVFGKPVIPAPLVFIMSFGLEALTGVPIVTGLAFLGVDQLRALRPVAINDTIHVETEVVEKHETSKPDRGIMTLKFTAKNQHGEPVVSFLVTRLVRRRPSQG